MGEYIPLPEAFIKQIRQNLPGEATALLEALDGERSWGLRLNPLRPLASENASRMTIPLEGIPWCPLGYYYSGQVHHPGRHPFHDAGLFYLQDPSAMAVAEALDVQPGQWVLDMCAAPGGKSTAIAGKLGGRGLLVANEYMRNRAGRLSSNLERWGAANIMIMAEHPENLAEAWGAVFDKVLVDAPCSGEGMFRKDPQTRLAWSEASAQACPPRQLLIMRSAAKLVKPGGLLVYSTCTFSPRENEDIARSFLAEHPDYAPQTLHLSGWHPGRNGELHCARMGPHIGVGEGHFVAAFQRTGGVEGEVALKKRKEYRDHSLWDAFCQEVHLPAVHGQLQLEGQDLYLYPDRVPAWGKLHCVRAGIPLGKCGKGFFAPHHSLAMTGWVHAQHALAWNTGEAETYLAGEVLEAPGKGWKAVTLCGAPLGWGKAGQGLLKNHLPTGLRHRGYKIEEEME